uniref:Uncharacterized protein n=1 Tax=Glossina austeni TaxID=7395 RepID=A0A1A9VP60_GLOAU
MSPFSTFVVSLVGFNTRTGIKLLAGETTAFPIMMLCSVHSLLGSTTHILLSLISWVAVAYTIASEFGGILCCRCTTTCNTSACLSYPTVNGKVTLAYCNTCLFISNAKPCFAMKSIPSITSFIISATRNSCSIETSLIEMFLIILPLIAASSPVAVRNHAPTNGENRLLLTCSIFQGEEKEDNFFLKPCTVSTYPALVTKIHTYKNSYNK